MAFTAQRQANLISHTARKIVVDEIDALPDSMGDVIPALNIRRQTYGRYSKMLVMSHPDKATGLKPERDWTKGVMALYAKSDRRVWYCPCPQCGAWSAMAPFGPRFYTLNYKAEDTLDEIAVRAHLACPVNAV